MDYGNRIYELRKEKDLSQEKVALVLEVSRQSISLWETNQASPSMDNLIALAKLFNVSLDKIVGLDKSVETSNTSEKILYTISYQDDQKSVYRREYNYISSSKDLMYCFISLFLLIFALALFLSVLKVNLEVARVLLIIGFVSILISELITPLRIYLNIKKKTRINIRYKIDLYDTNIKYTKSNSNKEEIDYKLIDYFVEHRDYILIYVMKGITLYIPKKDSEGLTDFLSSKVEERNRKKPFWNNL